MLLSVITASQLLFLVHAAEMLPKQPLNTILKDSQYALMCQDGYICATDSGLYPCKDVSQIVEWGWTEDGTFKDGMSRRLSILPTETVFLTWCGGEDITVEFVEGYVLNDEPAFKIKLKKSDEEYARELSLHHGPSGSNFVASNLPSFDYFVLVPKQPQHYQKVSWDELEQASRFHDENIVKFPLYENRLENLVQYVSTNQIEALAQNVTIFMHSKTYRLIFDYLAHKKANGSSVEKSVYQGMSMTDFINRLIKNRPHCFFGPGDYTMVVGDSEKQPMHYEWRVVGTEEESEALRLSSYLSYEEMELSALIVVSSGSLFINSGGRFNRGSFDFDKPKAGIFIGAVGPRFEHVDLMESKYMMKTGYRQEILASDDHMKKLWMEYYNQTEDTWTKDNEFQNSLHIPSYRIRLQRILDPILLHANWLSGQANKLGVLRLVGFGLGVWAISGAPQAHVYVEEVKKSIRLAYLPNIKIIELIWVLPDSSDPETLTTIHGQEIIFQTHKSDPTRPVDDEDRELLIATYAWDGNSMPGNEYWASYLDSSGDPAAACCSTIQELQNPLINKCLISSNALAVY